MARLGVEDVNGSELVADFSIKQKATIAPFAFVANKPAGLQVPIQRFRLEQNTATESVARSQGRFHRFNACFKDCLQLTKFGTSQENCKVLHEHGSGMAGRVAKAHLGHCEALSTTTS